MRLILISFALLLVFFLFSRMKLSHTDDCFTPSSVLHMWEFAAGICRGYLPWVFCIHKRILFGICEQVLFIWRQIFLICVQNFLICEIFFINTASSCYIVAIMGHRRTPMLWANLPEKYKTATSLDSFKTMMKIWKCETCFGRLCRTYQQNLGFYKKYFFQ